MIAALLTWLAIQATAADCAATAGREDTSPAAVCSETDGRTARGAAPEKAPVN
jgi:hypothetical protein